MRFDIQSLRDEILKWSGLWSLASSSINYFVCNNHVVLPPSLDDGTDDVQCYICLLLFSGEGMSVQLKENLIKIFDGRSGHLDGNGHETLFGSTMGLSIASEIVRKMGGNITVASALGHGTEFNVS